MLLPLFLNDVAGSEIIVIILVVLIFFGSKSIPGIAKTLGKTLYQIKNASAELQNEIKKSGFDIKEDLKISNLIKEQQEEITRPMDQVYSEIENTIHYSSESTSSDKIILEKTPEIKEELKPTTKKVEK
jgi:sec-independent protein translocase protein TatA